MFWQREGSIPSDTTYSDIAPIADNDDESRDMMSDDMMTDLVISDITPH